MGKLLIQGSTFSKSIHHPFYVSKKLSPVVATTPTPVPPTVSIKPTIITGNTSSPPTKFPHFITIAIKFDNHPEDIGWTVSSNTNVLIESKEIGFYTDKNKLV